jgi:hypothetical protein
MIELLILCAFSMILTFLLTPPISKEKPMVTAQTTVDLDWDDVEERLTEAFQDILEDEGIELDELSEIEISLSDNEYRSLREAKFRVKGNYHE